MEIVPQLVEPPESPFSGGMGCSRSLGRGVHIWGGHRQVCAMLWVLPLDWRFGNGFNPPAPRSPITLKFGVFPIKFCPEPRPRHHREQPREVAGGDKKEALLRGGGGGIK